MKKDPWFLEKLLLLVPMNIYRTHTLLEPHLTPAISHCHSMCKSRDGTRAQGTLLAPLMREKKNLKKWEEKEASVFLWFPYFLSLICTVRSCDRPSGGVETGLADYSGCTPSSIPPRRPLLLLPASILQPPTCSPTAAIGAAAQAAGFPPCSAAL